LIHHNDNEPDAPMSGHATCCGDTMHLVRIVLETNGSEVHVTQCRSCERIVAKSLFTFATDFEA
jgi:hypothetical protein